MSGEIFLAAKALHIIFVVAWFAALFYMPRLLIYFVEAGSESTEVRTVLQHQLSIMAGRLWNIIAWPAAILTIGTAILILYINPAYLQMPWMHVKLAFVALLLAYHGSLHALYRRMLASNLTWTTSQLRFYNELATLLLFAIVFTVVFKDTLSWAYGLVGILIIGASLSAGILLYKRYRKSKG